jgi:hypothetical protein
LLPAGLGLSSLTWATSVPGIPEDLSDITFDNRGTKWSEAPPGPYEIDDLADDAHDAAGAPARRAWLTVEHLDDTLSATTAHLR